MTTPTSLVHRIESWAQKTPNSRAHHVLRDGTWHTQTWGEHFEAISELAKGLLSLGQAPEQGVAIVGANRPEWVQSQFAIQAVGAWPVPLYPTSTLPQVGYIVGDANARIAFCDGQEQLERFLQAEQQGHMQPLTHLITFDAVQSTDDRVMSFEALRARGRDQSGEGLTGRLAGLTPDATCQLIYTSGTTGQPKGVRMNTTGQWAAIEGMIARFPTFHERPYRVVSYLPLCHQAEQLVTNVGALRTGGEVYFCPEIGQVKDYLLHAHPTLFLAVPRVWEKFEAALRARLGGQTGLAKLLADRAMQVELAGFDRDRVSGTYHGSLQRNLLRKLVLDKVRAGLGLDQLDAAFAGSAPIDPQTLRFFGSLGIPIYEAYGLTETSGLCTTNVYRKPQPGAVGPGLPGVTLKLAEDGEVLVGGVINTAGYHNLPDATSELFTEDGFLKTGDLGSLDGAGALTITGRKKEILITAGAKNVAPVEIEQLLNRVGGVGQSMVVGDRKPYLCAFITLDPEQLPTLNAIAGTSGADLQALSENAQVIEHVNQAVQRDVNSQLARYQTIKRIHILPREFTVEAGELTPSLKLRRATILEHFAPQFDEMY